MSASRFVEQTVDTDAATLKLGDEFNRTSCLMNSEVLLVLQDIQERRREEARILPIPPPSKVFMESLEHVRTFGHYPNRELVRAIRQSMSQAPDLKEFEMAQIGNLTPVTSEEAKMLVPSLHTREVDDDELQRVLDDISTARKYEM